MVQVGSNIVVDRQYENLASLKKDLRRGYTNVKEYIYEFNQVTTAGSVNIEEVSGETLATMSDETLYVASKTDQSADRNKSGSVEWMTDAGVLTSATFTTDPSNSSTATAIAGATPADHIRKFKFSQICADELICYNAGKTEVYAVIKPAYQETLKSKFMTAYGRRGFIGRVRADLSAVTAVVTITATFTPKGETLTVTKQWIIGSQVHYEWEPCIELAVGKEVSWTVIATGATPTLTFEVDYIEAYD